VNISLLLLNYIKHHETLKKITSEKNKNVLLIKKNLTVRRNDEIILFEILNIWCSEIRISLFFRTVLWKRSNIYEINMSDPLDQKQMIFTNLQLLGFDAGAMEAQNKVPFN